MSEHESPHMASTNNVLQQKVRLGLNSSGLLSFCPRHSCFAAFNVWAQDDMILSAGEKAQFNSYSGTQIDSGAAINIMAGTTSDIKSIGNMNIETTGPASDITVETTGAQSDITMKTTGIIDLNP